MARHVGPPSAVELVCLRVAADGETRMLSSVDDAGCHPTARPAFGLPPARRRVMRVERTATDRQTDGRAVSAASQESIRGGKQRRRAARWKLLDVRRRKRARDRANPTRYKKAGKITTRSPTDVPTLRVALKRRTSE